MRKSRLSIERDSRRAGGIGKTGDDFRRHGLSFDFSRALGMGRDPNPLLKAIERELACLEIRWRTVKLERPHSPTSLSTTISSSKRQGMRKRAPTSTTGMPTMRYFLRIAEGVKPVRSKSQPRAAVEDDQILRIKNDPGRVALAPLDSQGAAVH